MSDLTHTLHVQNLGKIFKNGPEELTVLGNINMEVVTGTTVVITGESGSGKSTLLNIIAGLDYPSYGKIIVQGNRIDNLSETEINDYRSHIVGLIFQFHYLLKDFTALENVMIPAYLRGENKKTALKKGEELLKAIGLTERLNHYPSQLSGGERQRVAVARSLINNPELILADEPTGNLDERNSLLVEEMLFELVKKYKKTLILVTHDKRIAEKGDVHYHLVKGELAHI